MKLKNYYGLEIYNATAKRAIYYNAKTIFIDINQSVNLTFLPNGTYHSFGIVHHR